VDTDAHARPFETFRARDPSYKITTDGSLSQVGIIIYKLVDGVEACVGCSAVSIADFGFNDDSSYQNTCEYVGMVLGVLALIKLGFRGVDIVVRGDSTTALSWMEKQKVSGGPAMNAALVLDRSFVYGIESLGCLNTSGNGSRLSASDGTSVTLGGDIIPDNMLDRSFVYGVESLGCLNTSGNGSRLSASDGTSVMLGGDIIHDNMLDGSFVYGIESLGCLNTSGNGSRLSASDGTSVMLGGDIIPDNMLDRSFCIGYRVVRVFKYIRQRL
jgi:hypothetical protein